MKKIILFLTLAIHSFIFAAEERYPVIILGGGVGALTSATYLGRAGISPLVITGPFIGGTINLSHDVQNWPGEIAISGDALSEKLSKQAEHNGAILRPEMVVSVDFSAQPFTITTKPVFNDGSESLKTYKADACIIAMGANFNTLNIPGEMHYWSRGVYTCAVCDGTLYKNKTVAVVGGGDSSMIEAQYLSNLAKKVYVIVRGPQMRASEKKRVQEVLARPNVEILFETVVQEIKGDGEKVTRLVLHNASKKNNDEIAVDALFLAIGSRPNTEAFRTQLELDDRGYILLKKHQQTSVDGVYALGDVADPEFKQAISAAGDGAKAAMQAQQYLSGFVAAAQEKETPRVVPVKVEKEVIEISSRDQFERELKEAKGPIFVDFYSSRCGPCRLFKPTYHAWARDFQGKIRFLMVNADTVGELFQIYQIYSVPTLVIFDAKGEIIRRSSGSREIAKIEKCLQKVKDKREIAAYDFK